MKELTKKHVLRLVALCYAAALAGWLLWNLGCFASDAFARKSGKLATRTYDFALVTATDGIEVQSTTQALTVTEDAQLILEDLPARVVEVRFDIDFSADPGEVTLFYAKAGEDFAKERKVWGKAQSDGSYVFKLPRTAIGRIRIDPTNQKNLTMTLNSLTVNPETGLGGYFALTYETVFRFLVWPGLAAACAGYLLEAFGPWLKKKLPHAAKKKVV